MKTFPKLYAKSKTGKTKVWEIEVTENADNTATKTTRFGYLDGAIQTKIEVVKEGKNLGKINATTPYEQAISEAQSDWQKKVDKNYISRIPTATFSSDLILPMLALDYRKRAHNIIFPCFRQPKLNGIRMLVKKLSDSILQFSSRKFKLFPPEVVAHFIKPLLEVMYVDEIFDGELYVHGWSLQKLSRYAKKARPDQHLLEYHIFDIGDFDLPYVTRYNMLQDRLSVIARTPQLQVVQALPLPSVDHVKPAHDEYVQLGYEGLILRNSMGTYLFEHRSMNLQKYKEFIDEEFLIVGEAKPETIINPITLEEHYAVVFKCFSHHAPEDIPYEKKLFDCRPRGTVADRVRMRNDLDDLIGKFLTVRYQELSPPLEDLPGGLPIFPVGIVVRDYE